MKKFKDFDKLYRKVRVGEFMDFTIEKIKKNKVVNEEEKIFDLAEEYFDLYEYTGDNYDEEVIYNEYKFIKSSSTLILYLKRRKEDIEIIAYDDEWYSIKHCNYNDYSDVEYNQIDYYIIDGFDGLKQWFFDRFGKK